MTMQPELPEDLQGPEVAELVAAFQDRENAQRPPGAALQGDDPLEQPAEEPTAEGDGDDGGNSPLGRPTPPSLPEPEPVTETPAQVISVAGRDYDPATLETYVSIMERLRALPEDQRRAIDEYVATGAFPTGGSPGPGASTPPAPGPDETEQEEWLDPRAGAEIAALQAQLAEVRALAERAVAADQRTEAEQITDRVLAAADAFVTERNLTAQDRDRLLNQAEALQVGPALIQTHRGDYTAATAAAMEIALWSLPDYRQKEIERSAQATVDTTLTEHAARNARKEKAGALAGSSAGSVPRDVAPRPKPGNRQEAIAAMASVIGEYQSNGVS